MGNTRGQQSSESPKASNEQKPWVAVTIAAIGALTSVSAAVIASRPVAVNATAAVFDQKISGGKVTAKGTWDVQVGRKFNVSHEAKGRFKITFVSNFDKNPIATVSPENGVCVARLMSVDRSSIEIALRSIPDNDYTDEGFSFLVLEGSEDK